MRTGALFAGYGGLELAAGAVLGAEPVWCVEISPHASAVLEARFPGIPNHGDVSAIDWKSLEPVDVLTGGFPCQDISSAGKRAGIRPGTRSGLWTHFAYAIDQLQPDLVVIENVRGLTSTLAHSDLEPCPYCLGDSTDGALRALGAVLGDLADIGYDARWHGVRASDIGAPHGRFRIFILAHPAGRDWRPRRAPAVLDPLESVFPTPIAFDAGNRGLRTGALSRAAHGKEVDLAHVIATLAGTDEDELDLLPTPAVNDIGGNKTLDWWEDWTADLADRLGNGNGHGRSLGIEAQKLAELLPTPLASTADDRGQTTGGGAFANDNLVDIVNKGLLPTPKARDHRHPGEHGHVNTGLDLPTAIDKAEQLGLLPTPTAQNSGDNRNASRPGAGPNLIDVAEQDAWGRYGPAVRRWAGLIRRSPPPPTMPAPTAGKVQLSPRFVEWMMGLPDGWVTDVPGLSRAHQLTILGNGVVPQQAAAALSLLIRED